MLMPNTAKYNNLQYETSIFTSSYLIESLLSHSFSLPLIQCRNNSQLQELMTNLLCSIYSVHFCEININIVVNIIVYRVFAKNCKSKHIKLSRNRLLLVL